MLYTQAISTGTIKLLEKISSIPELNGFNLAGGTALALQLGHRISFDLDFFGDREFTTQEIIDLLGDCGSLKVISQSKNILIFNIQDVKVDFVNYRYPLLTKPHIESGLRLLKPEDIAAMKLAAIAGRGRMRDFYDLYFLLKIFSLRQMLDFYNNKYEDGSELMVARSLTFFDDANQDENPRLIQESIEWEIIKKDILTEVRKLF